VQSVSENACPKTWTGAIIMENGQLPDLKAWRDGFREVVGEAFTIRGVEVVVDGRLIQVDGQIALEVSGSGQVLRLAPLRRTVEWDVGRGRPREPSAEERRTYQTLTASWDGRSRRVRIVGPLGEPHEGRLPVVEVRESYEGGTVCPRMGNAS
jgi:hypothetical protein